MTCFLDRLNGSARCRTDPRHGVRLRMLFLWSPTRGCGPAVAWRSLWLGVLAACLCVFLPRLAQAQTHDFIVERSWLQDPFGHMTWDEVRQQPMQPFSGTLNRGFGDAALWLRLRIDPQRGGIEDLSPDFLLLRMRPVYLDEVVVYDPLEDEGIAGVLGDRYHPRQDALQSADFLLRIERGTVPRDIWLRLQTTSSRQIHVQALAPHEAVVASVRQSVLSSLYIGMVGVLVVWALLSLVLRREPVMGYFALMQIASGLFGLSALGLLRVFWPLYWGAQALNIAGNVFSVLAVGCGLLFHMRFLGEHEPPAWTLRCLKAMLALTGISLLLLALGQATVALQINMVLVLLAPPVCFVCALLARAWDTQDPGATLRFLVSRRALVAFYGFFLVIFMLAATTGLGWLPASELTIYISTIHTLVISVLLMLMLQYRAFVGGRQRQHALLELERATLQMRHERQMREEQEKLLAMLAHEIKTPLATMHLRLDRNARGSQEIRQAIRDMNEVIERCVQTQKMDDGRLQPKLQRCDLTAVVRDAVCSCSQPDRVRTSASAPLTIVSDPQLLFIVLNNLLENACKYSAPDSPIELTMTCVETPEQAASVELVLANIPGAAGWPDSQQVFSKYYRSPQAKRQSGTGLGLYLVESLSRILGGKITYRPDSQWVRFVLTLPLPETPSDA